MGKVTLDGVRLLKKSLGFASNGYQYFTGVLGGSPEGGLRARFSGGHTVFLAEDGPREVFSVRGPWKKGATRPPLVVRKRGTRAVYVAVHDPSGRSVEAVRVEDLDGRGMLIEVRGDGFAECLCLEGIGRARRAGSGKKRKTTPGIRHCRGPRRK